MITPDLAPRLARRSTCRSTMADPTLSSGRRWLRYCSMDAGASGREEGGHDWPIFMVRGATTPAGIHPEILGGRYGITGEIGAITS